MIDPHREDLVVVSCSGRLSVETLFNGSLVSPHDMSNSVDEPQAKCDVTPACVYQPPLLSFIGFELMSVAYQGTHPLFSSTMMITKRTCLDVIVTRSHASTSNVHHSSLGVS